ncbi:hypothetical protein DRO54_04485 [Candidatus Bathyarchaeota archaeon]|nr:MAG: hypothetical protein DRO54_04485 [Candidatus Bathyarchaeota archaeon]
MEIEFVEKNIDLHELFNWIEKKFIPENGLKIIDKKIEGNKFSIKVYYPSIQAVAVLVIEGTSKNFVVSFNLEKMSKFLSMTSYIGIPFGTGPLLLREIRKKEEFERMERKLSTFLTQIIAILQNKKRGV